MASKGQSLTLCYAAWDTSANAGKTGDGSNHTLRWVKDGTSAAPDGSPSISEVDSTNCPGLYKVTLDSTDCTCNFGVLCGKSSTANISIMPIAVAFENLPTAAPAANGGLPTVDGSNNVHGIAQRTCTDASVIGTSTLTGTAQSGDAYAYLTTNLGALGANLTALPALIWNALTSGMSTAGSIGLRIINFLTGDSYTRLGAPAGASVSADIATANTGISNINNLSALANLMGPGQMEIPASSSIAYRFTLVVKDAEGHMEDLSGNPALAAINAGGTDRSANLSSVTHTSTGVYDFNYTVASSAAEEGLRISATGTAVSDSTSRFAVCNTSAVAVDTSAAIAAIKAKTDLIATNSADSPNAVTAQTTIATNLNAPVGSRSTLTQAQVTGGAFPLTDPSCVPAAPFFTNSPAGEGGDTLDITISGTATTIQGA